jgi:hypothetical protein
MVSADHFRHELVAQKYRAATVLKVCRHDTHLAGPICGLKPHQRCLALESGPMQIRMILTGPIRAVPLKSIRVPRRNFCSRWNLVARRNT